MFDDFCAIALYLIEILHQTTTSRRRHKRKKALYLIEILHQTTTFSQSISTRNGCILSKFYIKPQPDESHANDYLVVSYRNSTSNHNSTIPQLAIASVVSYRNSTSNHNLRLPLRLFPVLYLIEILHQTTTSNRITFASLALYLIEILHQTTTITLTLSTMICCILSKFYIKPQL